MVKDPEILSISEWRKLQEQLASTSKYRNKRTEVDGLVFASRKEARRYRDLKALQSVGMIRGLKQQESFPLAVNGDLICTYRADFTYWENGFKVVEDVKSVATKTDAYRIKKKLMKAIHGVTIRET